MFGSLVRFCKKVTRAVVQVARALASALSRRLRQAWAAHRTRVATDATYAAVTVVVLSGLFGVVPVKDVAGAVLAALLGVYATSRQPRSGADGWQPHPAAAGGWDTTAGSGDRWNDAWDLT